MNGKRMGMGMGMGGNGGGYVPLSPAGVDFSNETQAMYFLAEILDDTWLQVVANQYATYFWYGVVAWLALATITSLIWKTMLNIRIRASASGKINTAKPSNFLTCAWSMCTATLRESTYAQLTPLGLADRVRIPPLGHVLTAILYFGFVLVLEFVDNDISGAQYDQALGIRAGWLAVAQVPLLVLLAGKANIIGLITGTSYERLNVYHRCVARGLLVLSSMHFGFQSTGWAKYGLMQLEWNTDTCPPTGIAAYAFILWMNLTTLSPFRNLSYKVFVFQHVVTFMGFIIAVMYHLPSTALYSRVYIWIAIGIYLFDRCVRTIMFLWLGTQAGQARVEALDDAAIKIVLPAGRLKSWKAGSHMRLRFMGLDPWHAHPATISSIPNSHNGDLVFILRARGWITRRLLRDAQNAQAPLATTVLASGLYMSQHNDFAAYDKTIFIAGGSGISFTLGTLLDLADRSIKASSSSHKLPLRSIDFIWVVKQQSWAAWVADELQAAYDKLYEAGIEIKVHIYITGERSPSKDSYHDSDSGLETETDSPNKLVLNSTSVYPDEKDTQQEDQIIIETRSSPLAASYTYGRPDIRRTLDTFAQSAKGESAICVCGPFSMVKSVRNSVASISDERAVHKGTGAQGLYLHVANTCYT